MAPYKVLFVCIGNSCRSQMAEGFARAYGVGLVEPSSAGLAAAPFIAPATRAAMLEKNVDLDGQFPKELALMRPESIDIVVNISGFPLPPAAWKEVIVWDIPDPIGQSARIYRDTRDRIQANVLDLLAALRRRSSPAPPPRPSASSRVRFGRPRR